MCYDTNFAEAARRKSSKYEDLASQARANGYDTITKWVHVGFRSFSNLANMVQIPGKQLVKGSNSSPDWFVYHLVFQEQSL